MPAREVLSDAVAYPPKFGSPTSNAMRAGDFLYISGMMPWDKERRLVGLGDIKALHHTKLQVGNDTAFDFWLGIDQHYMPVKLRFPAARNRIMVEQTAIRISGE